MVNAEKEGGRREGREKEWSGRRERAGEKMKEGEQTKGGWKEERREKGDTVYSCTQTSKPLMEL